MARGNKKRRGGHNQTGPLAPVLKDTGEDGTINPELQERFFGRSAVRNTISEHHTLTSVRSENNFLVREYFAPPRDTTKHEPWTRRPEVPTAEELLSKVARSDADLNWRRIKTNHWSSSGWGLGEAASSERNRTKPRTQSKRRTAKKDNRTSQTADYETWGYGVSNPEQRAPSTWNAWDISTTAESSKSTYASAWDNTNTQHPTGDTSHSSSGTEKSKRNIRWGDEEDTTGQGAAVDDQVAEDDDILTGNDCNIVSGPWPSKNRYLKTHWKLIREEAFNRVRKATIMVQERPMLEETSKRADIRIYGDTYMRGVTFSNRGFAVRVVFSLDRIKKQIHWAQSDRLKTGTLVVLIAVDEPSVCHTATVAARPLQLLGSDPPEIDLFFSSHTEVEIDCTREWVMVEERTAYFEGSRHTLQALQKMAIEDFPLSEHLVDSKTVVEPPAYLTENPRRDLSSIFHGSAHTKSHASVDIVSSWPRDPLSEMDASQLSAVQRILTKRLALVQGPPGTGKTYVSVQALKVLLNNMRPGDPPIVITCQTNHALDQLLRHVAAVEPCFVRLGGRSKDNMVIKRRTLYEIRKGNPMPANSGSRLRRQAMHRIDELTEKIGGLLSPLREQASTIDIETLEEHNVLTSAQCYSLRTGKSDIIDAERPRDYHDPIKDWAGEEVLDAVPKWKAGEPYYDFEEIDPGFEELREEESENQVLEEGEQELDILKGPYLAFGDALAEKQRPANRVSDTQAKKALDKYTDLWMIPREQRGAVFRHILRKLKVTIRSKVRDLLPAYAAAVQDRKIGNWEMDAALIRDQKVIGVTTTGLSKYRGMIAGLQPKIVVIEEAAEAFEGSVIAACLPTIQHLILVGDHRQLPPHCNITDLEGEPHHLNVSLFERMVEYNKVESTLLKRQRRMIPEIRRLLAPIYGDVIEDHPIVTTERPPVPGMGGVNSFCFTHMWPEEKDDLKSVFNPKEAEMIVCMIRYLMFNGVEAEKITILTFYNGQRRMLINAIKGDPDLSILCANRLQIVTVDSYQGEENDIVMLSLVRCNDRDQIGFLESENRACVALSRARRGYYIFGDLHLLSRKSSVWANVISILIDGSEGIGTRVDLKIPLHCSKHSKTTWVHNPDEFYDLDGGCEQPCPDMLPCGHKCSRKCHNFPHEKVACPEDCQRRLPCRHLCNKRCSESCSCPCGNGGQNDTSGREAARLAAEQARVTRDLDSRTSRDKWEIQEIPRRPLPIARGPEVNQTNSIVSIDSGQFSDQSDQSYGPAGTILPNEDQRRRFLDEENERLLFGDGNIEADALIDLTEIRISGTRSHETTGYFAREQGQQRELPSEAPTTLLD